MVHGSTVEIGGVAAEEVHDFRTAFDGVFATTTTEDSVERFTRVTPLERLIAARSPAGEIVGTAGAFDFDVALPGGTSAPCASVTVVSVRADHRRRGVLTRMMAELLDQAAARDEPFAALWASESPIYGRYGFGPAAPTVDLDVPRAQARFHVEGPVDEVRLVDAEAALGSFPELYDAARRQRPGGLSYPTEWWRHRVLADPPGRREGAGPKQYAWLPGRGYAVFRLREGWDQHGPAGVVEVAELVALDPEATAALWRFVIDTDLSARTRAARRPVDEPLLGALVDPGRVAVTGSEPLYLRLVDLVGALRARRYRSDLDVVLAVEDRFRPANEGTWRLVVRDGYAECERTDAPPGLSLTADALATVYLGGVTLASLMAAGRVTGSRRVATVLDLALTAELAPWHGGMF